MEWSTVLKLEVPGTPVQQGSKNAIPLGRRVGGRFIPVLRKDGMPVVNITDNNADTLKPYRQLVTAIATSRWMGQPALDEDLSVTIECVFDRLKSHFGTGRNAAVLKPSADYFKCTKPDLDKLERSVLDALTDAKVWKDDSLVVELHGRKVYGPDAMTRIWVQTLQGVPGQQALV